MDKEVKIKKESTDFGTTWMVDAVDKSFRYALYCYDDDPTTFYLSNVFVKSEHRKSGLGNYILQGAENMARELHGGLLFLKVHKNTFVHDWYERHGFSDVTEDQDELNYMWMKKYLH